MTQSRVERPDHAPTTTDRGRSGDESVGARTAYLYFMTDDAERIRAVVPDHARYWKEQRLSGYMGGPFSDRSGGLISFDAVPDVEAQRLIKHDPFVREGLIEMSIVKRWVVEEP